MQTTAMPATTQRSWYDALNNIGLNLADRASESLGVWAQHKLNKELDVSTDLRDREASANQEQQAASAPTKGKDSDGSTITQERVTVGGVSVKRNTLKTAGLVLGGLGLGVLAYKAVK